MSVLPDREIEALCASTDAERYVDGVQPLIEPFVRKQLQPASYDVTLADEILLPRTHGKWIHTDYMKEVIDLREPLPDDLYIPIPISDDSDGWVLFPQQFILASTIERVCIPNYMVGRIEGKSSIGRLGITAHITAGYLDPGFNGNITLEIVNLFPRPFRLYTGMKIAQLSFDYLSSPCDRPYGSPELKSRYQDARGVEPSRFGDHSN